MNELAPSQPQPGAPASIMDPALLEELQQSIVGLVIVWEEPEGEWDWVAPEPEDPENLAGPAEMPVMSICSGWFATPTTIATAGHCVDPELGRQALDFQDLQVDPVTGEPIPPPPGRPEPKRTVYAFQPREVAGAVITAPTIVHVNDDFRTGDEGDIARLDIHGMPPGKPLAIAPAAPRIGETVVSIGFPGSTISETDGVDWKALESGAKNPAEVLLDSRLRPVYTGGMIGGTLHRDGVPVTYVNADFAQGMSGGPTINSRREVYGVNSEMTWFGQNFNTIGDTGITREFLGHNPPQPDPGGPQLGPAPVSAPAISASETGANTGEDNALGIAPSAVWLVPTSMLVGAALTALLSRRRRRPKHRSSNPGPVEETDTQQQDRPPVTA